MDRRFFLKLTGLVAAASALDALPVAAQVQTDGPATAAGGAGALIGGGEPAPAGLLPPGTYQFSGRVRLQEALVEVSGITNAHQISWARDLSTPPVSSFTSFEVFSEPWRMPEIRVRGGQLEALTVTPIELG